ncbi:MAG: SoxR reducing system RseC family protein [Candidatus Cloacimonetes bacterium]|nr:SoxR reducing system RseC family protein [Candidatus Cloacimonadota bacterium]MCF7813563.1 SoxR reducing system RseC family protein [Candidatus Cloacimonadota bacterium]MCF7868194.1 SoxR reducing system RseC family protein [Candidatus Cloacimonadota bacterium]MCF7883642.1 SoxR reducing system RseC family protein [Candidatus Cloacimonadota bacterium]
MEENKLEDAAVVIEVHDDFILVQMMKSGSCDSCGMSGLCHGKDRTVTHKIFTDKKYEVGDLLKVEVAPGLKIATSMLVFLVPILTMILFFAIASFGLHLSEPIAILSAFIGLILSGIVIYRIDRKFGKKIKFEIKEKVEK